MHSNKTQSKKQHGFTIIEIMIVLAIAGLIMAIVFFAVPGLQRSNRNTQRKNDATRLAALVAEYSLNHNRSSPPNLTTALGGPKWSYYTTVAINQQGSGSMTLDSMFLLLNAICNDDGSDSSAGGPGSRKYIVKYRLEPNLNRCIDIAT